MKTLWFVMDTDEVNCIREGKPVELWTPSGHETIESAYMAAKDNDLDDYQIVRVDFKVCD